MVRNFVISVQFQQSLVFQDEYIKYYAWKYEWRVDYRPPICKLCELLHENPLPKSAVDLDMVGKGAGCKNGQDMPWMIQRYLNLQEKQTNQCHLLGSYVFL